MSGHERTAIANSDTKRGRNSNQNFSVNLSPRLKTPTTAKLEKKEKKRWNGSPPESFAFFISSSFSSSSHLPLYTRKENPFKRPASVSDYRRASREQPSLAKHTRFPKYFDLNVLLLKYNKDFILVFTRRPRVDGERKRNPLISKQSLQNLFSSSNSALSRRRVCIFDVGRALPRIWVSSNVEKFVWTDLVHSKTTRPGQK